MTNTWLERRITLHNYDTPSEERANMLTHALGAVLSLVALILLLTRLDGEHGVTPLERGACIIFGGAMVLTYLSSALYHHVRPSNLKRVFRILDHVNIYILIAGTYTPFCVVMDPRRGTPLLILIWSLVVAGIVFKLVFWGRHKVLHTLVYLAMGWLVVFYINDLRRVVPVEAGYWILGGGLAYSVGTLFYASKKLPYYHAIWHLFVLAGSLLFWWGIYLHVLPVMVGR